jgi:FtsH-binding integral membrane protein
MPEPQPMNPYQPPQPMNPLQPMQPGGTAIKAAEPTFFAKVMFFFGLAILTSAAGTYVGFNYLIELFIANNAIMWILLAIELALVFTARLWSTKRPINYVLFAAFAFITGVTLVPLLASVILEFGGPDIIIKALLATTLMFGGTAVFGWVTHRDLSGLGGFLLMALIGMIIVSLIRIFIPGSNTFEMIFSGVGVLVFSGYTMYDFQKLKMMPQDRPLDAALNLYLDIFNMFIYILRLMSGSRRR